MLALATVLVALVVAFVVLEVLVRWLWTLPPAMAEFGQGGLYETSASGGTGLCPGYRGVLQVSTDVPGHEVAINSLGMRGDEVGEKQPGERRLLVVGDSLVFGYGVAAVDTFAAQLQTRLRDSGRTVTVGNGGISGFGSYEAAQRIGDLRPTFAPDAVLFTIYLGNDAFDNRNRDVAVVGGLRFTGPWAVLMRESRRARLATRARSWLWFETWLVTNAPSHSLLQYITMSPEALALREGFPGTPPVWAETHAGLFLDVLDEATAWPAGAPPVIPRVLDDFRAALQSARQAANGLPLAVLVLPTWWHVDATGYAARLEELGFAKEAFRRGRMQERLQALATELGLPLCDATPWLEAATVDRTTLFISDRGHLSAAGNAVVAAGIAACADSLWQ
jgi:lysophospholipase L1-like esterase